MKVEAIAERLKAGWFAEKVSPVLQKLAPYRKIILAVAVLALLWFGSLRLQSYVVYAVLALSVALALPMMIAQASEAFQTRRFRWWAIAFYAMWAVAVVVMLTQCFSGIEELSKPMRFGNSPMEKDMALQQRASVYFALVFNLFGLLGAAGVAAATANPFHWIGKKRLIWGGLALALMLGKPLVGLLSPVVGWIAALGPSVQGKSLPFLLLFKVAPFVLQLAAGLFVPTLFLMGFVMVFGLTTAPVAVMFNNIVQIEQRLAIFDYKKSGVIGKLVRFGYWLRGEALPEMPDDSKGARFATTPEMSQIAYDSLQKNEKAVAVFGHLNGSPYPLYTDKHILIMASTRSGKGVSLIIPHLLRYEGSAFVLDPKGENAKATGRQRAALNDTVLYLDPFGVSGKPQARFNPLSRFTPENMEAESKALAAALVMGERGVRDHWSASAQQLLAAFIMHVYTSPDVPPEEKDLPKVRRLLLRDVPEVLKAMLTSDKADGLLSSLAASFLDTPEKEFGSIVSTAQRETEILDNPFIIKCLKADGPGDEVNFSDWRTGTMTVFLCLSAPKFPVFSRWLRLVLTSALDEMTDSLNPPPLPVCFMLDELATLGHLQAVENAVGLAAGYGIQLVTVFQDVAQMKDLYKGRWASFIGNAGVKAVFNTDDFETAKYWSDFLGSRLEESVSQQKDIYGFVKGQTASERHRPLLAPEEIMLQFAQGKMLVLPQGSRPVVTDRVAYFNDQSLAGLWDDPRKP